MNRNIWGFIVGIALMIILPKIVGNAMSQASTILFWLTILGGAILASSSGLAYLKEVRVKRMLIEAGATDSIWSLDDMKVQARGAFYALQKAWDRRDDSVLEGYATNQFCSMFKEEIMSASYTHDGPLISFDIEDTRIISFHEYKDISKDKFVAYLKGKFENGDLDEEFSYVLYFVRKENVRLLEKLNSGLGYHDLITNWNVKE